MTFAFLFPLDTWRTIGEFVVIAFILWIIIWAGIVFGFFKSMWR